MNEGNEKYPQIDYARSADPDCSSFVIPIFYSVFNSFKSQKEILSTTMTFFPNSPSLENYLYVFQHGSQYLGYYVNSLKVTFIGVILIRYTECNERICLCKASF